MPSIQEIGHNIRTQDNAITALPMFCVQQRERIYGLGEGYAAGYDWINPGDDYHVADEAEATVLEKAWKRRKALKGWQRIGYVDRWVFVTACFTRAGCEAYLAVNGHNLKQPRIYVETGFRNAEWEMVRNLLVFMDACATSRSEISAERGAKGVAPCDP